jgi:hypothetical protein
MKIDAGWKLNQRNPMHAPARATVTTAAAVAYDVAPISLVRMYEYAKNDSEPIAMTPDAKPSSPSTKFTALMIATKISVDTSTESQADPTVTPKMGTLRSCTPPIAIPPEMRICPVSLVSQSSSHTSSTAPKSAMATVPKATDHRVGEDSYIGRR